MLDGHAGDSDVATGDIEDAAGIATDSQLGCARSMDGQVLVDDQLPAGQGDGARDGKVDGVARGGIRNRLAERARPAVVEVGDGEGSPLDYTSRAQDRRQQRKKHHD